MVSTLRDVAARAGVSIKTVSNVVNDRPYVTDETRQRVLHAIEELGYRPNLSARHLRHAHVGIIALAIPDLNNDYFCDLANAVIKAAPRSYTVLIDHTGGDRAAESLVANGLRPHLIDGVILSPLALQLGDLQPRSDRVPIVLLGEQLFGAPRDHIAIDNVAAARTATQHLLDLGRQRIAAIGVAQDATGETSRLRLQGFTEALRGAGRPLDSHLLVPAPGQRRGNGTHAHRADGALAMQRLLAQDHPPDAVFCFNDLLALGAMRSLHEAGCRIPDDVAVVGFDDLEEGLFSTPTLTTICPNKDEIGQLAVSLLLDRIHGIATGPPQRLEPGFRLVIRESTAGTTAGRLRASDAEVASEGPRGERR